MVRAGVCITNATRMDFSGGVNCSEHNLTINGSCFELSTHDFESLIWIKASLTVLTGISCCFTVGMILFFKAYKMFGHRIALYLNVAALVTSVTIALQIAPMEDVCGYVDIKPGNVKFCEATGFLAQYFAWVIMAFTSWITLHLFMLAVLRRHYKSRRCEVGSVIACLLLPLAFSIVPFIDFKNGTLYGQAGIWCWIKTTTQHCRSLNEGVIEQFTLFFGPLMFSATLIFLAMLVVVITLYRGTRKGTPPYSLQEQYKEALKEALPLVFYPIFFIVIFSLAFAIRVYFEASKNNSFPLWVVYSIALQSLPLFIPWAFLLHPDTLKRLKCSQLKKAVMEWKHQPQHNIHTHYVVPKEDVCAHDSSSEVEPLVIRGHEETTFGYRSFLAIPQSP